jgi:glucosamine-6-phosphate deaminase
MDLRVLRDRKSLGQAAAEQAASSLRDTLRDQGSARLVAATGASQFEFLDALTKLPDIDWGRVEMFHLDEYIGLPIGHRASFRRYLLERLIYKTGITRYHFLDTEGDLKEVVRTVGKELKSRQVDLAFVGIGENAHLAFNDPPADFENEEPYLIVDLDEACRRQQVGEGWFADLSEVPQQAISMSVRQILKAKQIFAVVPDARKAQAVKTCCEGDVTPLAPASILRTHSKTTMFLDEDSAALLSPETRKNGVCPASRTNSAQKTMEA